MDVKLQAKLLRAIQERVIDRVGGNRQVPVDIRIIATSNRNLIEAVREGKFREDLLFRLNVVNLKIPALRERPSDIGELAEYFIKKYSKANGLPVRALSTEARRALVDINRWPGNVRELENTLHRAVLLSSGVEIGVDGILSPDGARLDQARGTDLIVTCRHGGRANNAQSGRTHCGGGPARPYSRNAQALPGQPHACVKYSGYFNTHAAQQAQ